MNEITIHIFHDSADEYQYAIYKGSPEEAAGTDPIDGGACTTNMQNAIEMAAGQAKKVV
jgi:hypothetical protein